MREGRRTGAYQSKIQIIQKEEINIEMAFCIYCKKQNYINYLNVFVKRTDV